MGHQDGWLLSSAGCHSVLGQPGLATGIGTCQHLPTALWTQNKLDAKLGQSASGGRLTWRCHALSLTECVCNYLGTVREDCEGSESCRCEAATGQCRCLPNVVGLTCDRCAPHTWRLASGTGCEQCDCDPARSLGPACNEVRECGHGP